MDPHILTKSRIMLSNSEEFSSANNTVNTDDKMNPADFLTYLPWACQQFSVDCTLDITRIARVGYTSRLDLSKKGRSKAAKRIGSELSSSSQNTFPVTSSQALISLVRITATYSGDNLTYIKIDKTKHLPRELLAILALIIPFYPHLYGISINSGTDKYTIHEMCKILPASNITEINMDNTCIKEEYYDALLDNASQLKVLSLARCNLDDHAVGKIVSKLEQPNLPSKTLSVLNFSTNRITDKGAKHIAKMLRTNRHLSYLNIASNSLTDDGAGEILNVLYKFPLTAEETLLIRKDYLSYLKSKQLLIEENMINLREAAELEKYRKKSFAKKSLSGKGSHIELLNLENILHEKAVKMAELVCGTFDDPLATDTFSADGFLYSNGNNTLAYLNIAYNSVSHYTLKQLLKILKHQNSLTRTPRGLVNVRLEGNPFPKDSPELLEIDNILEHGLAAKEKANLKGKHKEKKSKEAISKV